MMKKVLALFLVIGLTSCNEIQQVINQMPQGGVLSQAEIASGLRQALDLGIDKQVSKLTQKDGFFKNELVKILLPEELQKVDKTLRDILNELIDSPATSTSEPTVFNFIGGTLSNPTFNALLTLFQIKGYDIDVDGNQVVGPDGNPGTFEDGYPGTEPLFDDAGNRLYYPDGTPRNKHEWPTTVVVYDWDDCSNPNKPIEILGYSEILLTDVLDAPDKFVQGKIMCNLYEEDNVRGGGGSFGIKGNIPGLVE